MRTLLPAICMVVFSAIMIGFKFFLDQMTGDFDFGMAAGFFLAAGLIFLVSKQARNLR